MQQTLSNLSQTKETKSLEPPPHHKNEQVDKSIYAINAHLGHKFVFITYFFLSSLCNGWCDFRLPTQGGRQILIDKKMKEKIFHTKTTFLSVWRVKVGCKKHIS